MHYAAIMLQDGTELAAYPMAMPARRIVNRDHIRFDAHGMKRGWSQAGRELTHNENRFRFHDIIWVNLNTRRANRELVLPVLAEMAKQIAGLRREARSAPE